MACNGQRAICLCSHLMAKQAAKNAGKTVYKGGGATHKEETGPGGASHHFLLVQKKNPMNTCLSWSLRPEAFLYSFLFHPSVEYVPKV